MKKKRKMTTLCGFGINEIWLELTIFQFVINAILRLFSKMTQMIQKEVVDMCEVEAATYQTSYIHILRRSPFHTTLLPL